MLLESQISTATTYISSRNPSMSTEKCSAVEDTLCRIGDLLSKMDSYLISSAQRNPINIYTCRGRETQVDKDIQTIEVIREEESSKSNDIAVEDMCIEANLDTDSHIQEVLTCTNCEKEFASTLELDYHLESIHNMPTEFSSNVL